jgi:hypothetical protein
MYYHWDKGMGQAQLRRQKLEPRGQLVEKQTTIPESWAVVCIAAIDDWLSVSICAAAEGWCKTHFLQATGLHPSVLDRLPYQGFVQVGHPKRLIQFAIVSPERIQIYVAVALSAGRQHQLQRRIDLVRADEASFSKLVDFWQAAQAEA